MKLENLGKVAGTVYFTSTVGGIASTFLFGFYLIPGIGMKLSAYYTAIALITLPIIWLIYSKIAKKEPHELEN